MRHKNRSFVYASALAAAAMMLIPQASFAGLETMMSNLQSTLLTVLAPIVCVGGIIFSAFRLAMGDESAKRMLFWSCIGTVAAFTAPSIMSFLQTRVAA